MSLIDIVSKSPLAEEVKKMWISRIEAEGNTPDVVAGVKEALQEYIDNGFQAMGVALDMNDPAVKAEYDKMESGIAAAQAEYEEKASDLEAQAAAVQKAATKDLDKLEAQVVKAGMEA